MSFKWWFYGSNNPFNSVTALKDKGLVNQVKVNPTMLSLQKKVKNATKKLYIYSTMQTKDTEVLGR